MSDEEIITDSVKKLIAENVKRRPEQNTFLRKQYQQLINEAQIERENDSRDLSRINQILEEAENLYLQVCRPREALLDAKLLSIHNDFIKQEINRIQAGNQFNTLQFVRKLILQLHGIENGPENILRSADWVELGKRTSVFINRTPKLNFIHGTFSQCPEVNRTRRRMRDKEERATLSEVKATDPMSRDLRMDQTAVEVQHIQTTFLAVYEKEGRPLCFFKFIIDPHSFSKTIENMFHFATLIKDGYAYMFLGGNNTPLIKPVDTNISENVNSKHPSSHCLFTMTVKRWRILIRLFGITQATIK